MTRTTLSACALALALAQPALAAASGEQIRGAIAGNTVQGSMAGGGPYVEFYDPSGAIKGKGYVGQWSVEGDLMCFAYQATPKQCWNVDINGNHVSWIRNGATQGTGTIIRGNPNGL
ncbi:MAG: hypothetical protein R3D05_03030 [Dongiaceae bacterium]